MRIGAQVVGIDDRVPGPRGHGAQRQQAVQYLVEHGAGVARFVSGGAHVCQLGGVDAQDADQDDDQRRGASRR